MNKLLAHFYFGLALILSVLFSFTGVLAFALFFTIPAAIYAKKVFIWYTFCKDILHQVCFLYRLLRVMEMSCWGSQDYNGRFIAMWQDAFLALSLGSSSSLDWLDLSARPLSLWSSLICAISCNTQYPWKILLSSNLYHAIQLQNINNIIVIALLHINLSLFLSYVVIKIPFSMPC